MYTEKKFEVESFSVEGWVLPAKPETIRLTVTAYREKRNGDSEEIKLVGLIDPWSLLCARDTLMRLVQKSLADKRESLDALEHWLDNPHE